MNSHLKRNRLRGAARVLILTLYLIPGFALATAIAATATTSATAATPPPNSSLNLPLSLGQGWNLVGNSLGQTMQVATVLGDAATINSVWKWDSAATKWKFYSPSLDPAALNSYAAGKGYDVLSTIGPGEGYWVNAKQPKDLGTQTGLPYKLSAAQLLTGWNLAATGVNSTPSAFNASLSATPPADSVVPINLTTLWAWDNATSKWYFYAPSLEAQGGTALADYATGKDYLDFTQAGKTLGNQTGFWVNKVQEPPVVNVVGHGQLKEAVQLKTISVAEIAAAIELAGESVVLATPRYAVQAYRLTYLTVDGQDQEILASALVVLPQKPGNSRSPVLSYQHATITREAEAPSNLAEIGSPEIIMASLGYIVLSADYVGYGVSKGSPHPYLLSGPSAAAILDLLTAAKYWRQTQHVLDNGQLFLAGYSEGGYVTMAAQRALQAGASTLRNEVIGLTPGAGPYDVGLTLDELLDLVRQEYPLIGGLLSPGLLKYLSDANRHKIRDELLKQLLGDDADVTFMPDFIDNYFADDRSSIESQSNVNDWLPEVPVNFFHGRDDRTVSYSNASSTLQAMRAKGSGDLANLTDCTMQPAGHLECVQPYWRFMLDTFARVAKDL